MAGYIVGILALGALWLVWFVAGLAGGSSRREQLEREQEEWSGVLDVKRETRDKLKSDPDYAERVQDEFND